MDPMETSAEPVQPESEQDTATATMVPEKKKEPPMPPGGMDDY
jgi:hypothetical protein